MEKLLGFLSEGLGLDPNYIRILNKEPMLRLRINCYPPCPHPEMVNGAKPHSDRDMLTLLLNDNGVDGLQIWKDNYWLTLPSVPGALIIMIGDLLQIVSNGKYTSVEHRAVTNEKKNRMSIVMFATPQEDVLLGPTPQLIDAAHPSLYKTVKAGEYRIVYITPNNGGKGPPHALLTEHVKQVNV